MKKGLITIGIVGLLINCIPSTVASAAETDTYYSDEVISETEGLLFQYNLNISSSGRNVIINAKTISCDIMKKIGFKNIKIQRSSNGTSWTTEKTLEDILNSDSKNYVLSDYSVSVTGGYYYRVVCTHYAKENGWFGGSQSVDNTSNSVWIN